MAEILELDWGFKTTVINILRTLMKKQTVCKNRWVIKENDGNFRKSKVKPGLKSIIIVIRNSEEEERMNDFEETSLETSRS